MEQHWPAKARCFGERDVPWHNGAEHLIVEMFDKLIRNFVGQIDPRIDHRAQQPINFKLRVDGGTHCLNALTAADGVLIPMQCEYYALEGLSALLSTIETVRTTVNPELEVYGLLQQFDRDPQQTVGLVACDSRGLSYRR